MSIHLPQKQHVGDWHRIWQRHTIDDTNHPRLCLMTLNSPLFSGKYSTVP